MMERHNRKSHLAPLQSSATKSSLRDGSSSASSSSTINRTPNSVEMDIPIGALSIDSNGSSYANSRPLYPVRTSSASHAHPAYQTQNTTALPIRPAPPPDRSLPQVPRQVRYQ